LPAAVPRRHLLRHFLLPWRIHLPVVPRYFARRAAAQLSPTTLFFALRYRRTTNSSALFGFNACIHLSTPVSGSDVHMGIPALSFPNRTPSTRGNRARARIGGATC